MIIRRGQFIRRRAPVWNELDRFLKNSRMESAPVRLPLDGPAGFITFTSAPLQTLAKLNTFANRTGDAPVPSNRSWHVPYANSRDAEKSHRFQAVWLVTVTFPRNVSGQVRVLLADDRPPSYHAAGCILVWRHATLLDSIRRSPEVTSRWRVSAMYKH